MAGKRRKVTAPSTLPEETENFQQRVLWDTLPPYVLEMIYSHLCRQDQVNMSVVCSGWSKGYGSPSVWRNFLFTLNESQLSTNDRFYMKFAEKYCRHFQHVKVYCKKLSKRHLYNSWRRRFIYFLEMLIRKSELESIEFLCVGFCSNPIDNTKVYETISDFLNSQQDLRRMTFEICEFSYHEGNQLFKIISQKQGKNLTHFVIKDYFSLDTSSQEILDGLEELPRILAFPKLETLEIDYSMELDYLLACNSTEIEKFEKNTTHRLSKIKLSYDVLFEDEVPLSQGLTSNHWKILTTMFPNLQVEIFIEFKESTFGYITAFFKPNMPITNLVLHCTRHDIEMEIAPIFDCLRECQTNDYLETLAFQCLCDRIDNFEPFLSFIQVCKKLKYLLLSTKEPINAITLIKDLKENEPDTLKDVYIVDKHMKNKPDYPKFKESFDRNSNKLKFNLHLVDSSEIKKFLP